MLSPAPIMFKLFQFDFTILIAFLVLPVKFIPEKYPAWPFRNAY